MESEKRNQLLFSVLEQDRSPIVVCDLNHTMIYLNPTAVKRYERYGGQKLLGQSLMRCHNADSKAMIEKILDWFRQSEDNNIIYESRNEKEEKDVYIVALRDPDGKLIGYYEKHEYRTNETVKPYDFNHPVSRLKGESI